MKIGGSLILPMEYVDIKLTYTTHITHTSYILYNTNTYETDVKHSTSKITCIPHSCTTIDYI